MARQGRTDLARAHPLTAAYEDVVAHLTDRERRRREKPPQGFLEGFGPGEPPARTPDDGARQPGTREVAQHGVGTQHGPFLRHDSPGGDRAIAQGEDAHKFVRPSGSVSVARYPMCLSI